MERLESVAPFLNTPWWSSRPSVERSGKISNGNKPCAKKESDTPDVMRVGGCLVRERKASQDGRLKELEVIESSISCPHLDERNLAKYELLQVSGA